MGTFVDHSLSADKDRLWAPITERENDPSRMSMQESRNDTKVNSETYGTLTTEQEKRLDINPNEIKALRYFESLHLHPTTGEARYIIKHVSEYQRLCKSVFMRGNLDIVIEDYGILVWPREYTISLIKDLIHVGILKFSDFVNENDRATIKNFTDKHFPKSKIDWITQEQDTKEPAKKKRE